MDAIPQVPSYNQYRTEKTGLFRLFFQGLLAPPRVLLMMFRRPSIWGQAGMAIMANVFLFLVIASLSFAFTDDLVNWLWTQPEAGFLLWLWWFFAVLSGVVLLAMCLVTSIIMIGPVASPFLQGLSRLVEKDWLGELSTPPFEWSQLLPQLPSLVGKVIKKLTKYMCISLPIMGLVLIPVVGPPLAIALEFIVTGMFLAVDFMGFPLDRRGYGRKDRFRFVTGALPALLGLGLALAAMLLIPFAGLLVIPIGIQAGTLVFLGLEDQGRVPINAPELADERDFDQLSCQMTETTTD